MTSPGLVEVELKEEAFRSERRLRLHGRSEHRDGTRERSHARDKSFYLRSTLRQHRLSHSGEKTFACERCGKSCARKGDLETHMLSRSRERPHACGRCGAAFKQPEKLKQHERLHTGRTYRCPLCPKSFGVHVALCFTHTGEKPFKCNACPKAFSGRSNLKKHTMTHTGERPYRCSHCGKGCRLLQHLVVHGRGHTDERPYACAACGKSYTNPSALKTGRVTPGRPEMPEKPHRCSQCGKSFSQAVNLKKYSMVHLGEKPYGCTACGKQVNDDLAKHVCIHTGEKPFECERCHKSFRLLQHLEPRADPPDPWTQTPWTVTRPSSCGVH